MLRKLEYQDRVLDAIDAYLVTLKNEKARSDTIARLAADDPELLGLEIPDFAAKTWTKLKQSGTLPPSRAAIPYSPRHDGVERPVPNIVLKVPTGGGKTFLATQALSRVFGQYLSANTGFVLWIVPNEAIYSQTLRHFSDRQHPYRQALDRAAAGRVRIMEKADRLDARDIESQLCVMLLMLQSANRETNETLKMFQDRDGGGREFIQTLFLPYSVQTRVGASRSSKPKATSSTTWTRLTNAMCSTYCR